MRCPPSTSLCSHHLISFEWPRVLHRRRTSKTRWTRRREVVSSTFPRKTDRAPYTSFSRRDAVHIPPQVPSFSRRSPIWCTFRRSTFGSISTFWSMEFLSVVFSMKSLAQKPRTHRRISLLLRRCSLLFVFSLVVLLGALLGPSVANLMRPRLDFWPAGGSTFWINATVDSLYPLNLFASSVSETCQLGDAQDTSCPSSGFETISLNFMSFWPTLTSLDTMPETILVPSRHALREMTFRNRAHANVINGSRVLWPNRFSTVTVNSAAESDATTILQALWIYAAANAENRGRLRYRRDAVFKVATHQPVVMARCDPFDLFADDQDHILGFADLGSIAPKALQDPTADITFSISSSMNATTRSNIKHYLASTGSPGIRWLDDLTLISATKSSLNAVVLPPQAHYETRHHNTTAVV